MKQAYRLSPALLGLCIMLLSASCVSNKKYARLQQSHQELQSQMIECDRERNAARARADALERTNTDLREQVQSLRETNNQLISNVGNLTTLSTEGARNLEKSLESMREKDLQIQTLRDAVTRRDSVTLALVTSLKGVLGNMDDQDIEVNVEKGVVYISISDKLLFNSGSYNLSPRANEVLGKVATVIKNKPELEFLVEGHTDDVPINKQCIPDNWALSVLRATAVVRSLQNEFGIAPERMTAAGRSMYVPKTANDTPEQRAENRRTRIVVLPKLDQFYALVDEGMKEAIEESEAADDQE